MDIFKKHILIILVLLEARDTVLIERVMGKRIDPDTGGRILLFITIVIIYNTMTIKLLTVILENYLAVTPYKSQNKPSDHSYIPQI